MFDDPAVWLPFVFAALMGLAILIYVILDGFDLGIGMLVILTPPEERDTLISTIGPFWDANETWLVLAVGLLLVAFPIAHGVILTALYGPVALMLFGLILRGVAFEFRAKVPFERKARWDLAFFAGSALAAVAQGYMLGIYVMGLQVNAQTVLFSLIVAGALAVAYSFMGAAWLILKTSGPIQLKAITWARRGLWGLVLGLAAVSAATPLVSIRIWQKWTELPAMLWLAPLPILSLALIIGLWRFLATLPRPGDRGAAVPFLMGAGLFLLGFIGMAYSFYPYVVPERLTIWQAASAPESLRVILIGAVIVLPLIAGYTALSYTVFRGKASQEDIH